MQRNYEIKNNSRTIEDGFEQSEKKRISVNLTEEQIEAIDRIKEKSRSRKIREIINFFFKEKEGRR